MFRNFTLIYNRIALNKLLIFSFPLFFIYISEGMMAYLFPIVFVEKVNSNTLLGLTLAVGGIIGLTLDLRIPFIFANKEKFFKESSKLFTNLGSIKSEISNGRFKKPLPSIVK